MTCQQPSKGLLSCNIKVSHVDDDLFPVIYTDLFLNQFNVAGDFDRLLKELRVDSPPDRYNYLIIGDDITVSALQKKLPPRDGVYAVAADVLRRRYDGTYRKRPVRAGDGASAGPNRHKVLKNPIRTAFRLDEIHSFPNRDAKIIVFLINVYKSLFVERLLEDNDRTRLRRCFVILNSLLEFPFMYTLEKSFTVALFNDIADAVDGSKTTSPTNYNPASFAFGPPSKRVANADSDRLLEQEYVSIDVEDIVNDVPAAIRADVVYVFDLSKVRDALGTNAKIYRLFKMFYYTYCFNGARWAVHPNDVDNSDTLYTFRRHFDEELLIVSKWWPDDETLSVVLAKLRRWCPPIFGSVSEWFFHCDVREIFSAARTHSVVRLPYIASRPLFPGGHVWEPPTLAYMALARVGIGTSTVMHVDVLCENRGKKELVGFYANLFAVEYDTRI